MSKNKNEYSTLILFKETNIYNRLNNIYHFNLLWNDYTISVVVFPFVYFIQIIFIMKKMNVMPPKKKKT